MNNKRRILSCLLTFSILLTLAWAVAFPASAEAAPLSLRAEYDPEENTVQVVLMTDRSITLTNYDLRLSWDVSRFTLTEVRNGQESLLPSFLANTVAGDPQYGTVGAMSGGLDVSVPAGSQLAVFCFSVSELPGGTYAFSLAVVDAADENSEALPWKDSVIETELSVVKNSSSIRTVTAEGASVICEARCLETGAYLFFAAYDEFGRLLSIRIQPANGDGTVHSYSATMSTADWHHVRVFLAGNDLAPLATPGKTAS